MSDVILGKGELGKISISVTGALERLEGWTGVSIVRGIDQASDAFSFTFPWEATEDNKALFVAYRTSRARISYDNELIVTGIMEKYAPTSSADGNTMTVEGRSESGVIMDISAKKLSYEQTPFNTIASDLSPISVRAIPDGPVDIEIEPGETVWSVLSKLAAGINLYAFPQADGSLLFQQISKPATIGSIIEGESPVNSISTSMDLTKRFYRYTAVQTVDGQQAKAETIDTGVDSRLRDGQIIEPQQQANVTDAANFARNRGIMDSYTCTVNVTGWTIDGTLWAPGMVVNVNYPSAMIYRDSELMVKRATLSLDETSGATTTLELTFPQVFTGGDITSAFPYPWSL